MSNEFVRDGSLDGGAELERPDRRRALKIGAAVTGAAWVAPAILSLDAAAAQTGPGPGPNGAVQGVMTCPQNQLPQTNQTVQLLSLGNVVIATDQTDQTGFYQFLNVVPGTYLVGHQFGFKPVTQVTAGNTTVANLQFCS